MDLYKRYRPKTLADVAGQFAAVASLQRLMDKGKLPHCILLTGPSGTGKTTIGRIIKRFLKCGSADYQEVDCAVVESPLDTVRMMRRVSNLHPMAGDCRVWFLEEAQSLSRAGFSQQAMLKLLEDVSDTVYFILATTDAQKLHRAVHTRCTEIRLIPLPALALEKLLLKVIAAEKMEVSEDVVVGIVEAADGSARKALVILEQVAGLKGDTAQMQGVQGSSVNKSLAIDLARALINPRAQWAPVATLLKDLKDEDPEGLRYLILGYARSVMLGGGNLAPRAFMIIDYFSDNFYDSKQAGLAAACWAVVQHR
jgi:DNA polymerase III subunit gamma/tau